MKAPPQKRRSPAGEGEASQEAQQNVKKFSAASAAKQAQLDRIMAALRRRPHTSHDLRGLGVYQVSARIKELREQGNDISTARITLIDAWGYEHRRCALYSLGGAQ
jgi:hypothetical protein